MKYALTLAISLTATSAWAGEGTRSVVNLLKGSRLFGPQKLEVLKESGSEVFFGTAGLNKLVILESNSVEIHLPYGFTGNQKFLVSKHNEGFEVNTASRYSSGNMVVDPQGKLLRLTHGSLDGSSYGLSKVPGRSDLYYLSFSTHQDSVPGMVRTAGTLVNLPDGGHIVSVENFSNLGDSSLNATLVIERRGRQFIKTVDLVLDRRIEQSVLKIDLENAQTAGRQMRGETSAKRGLK